MPYTTLYALSEKAVEHYLTEVKATLEGDRQRMWPFLFKSWEGFQPRPLLSTTGSTMYTQPLTNVSHFTSPSVGWKNLTVDEIPRLDDPRVQWLLTRVVLETAEYVFNGADDKFNAAFCIWIPDQEPFRYDEERAQFEWWCQNLFSNREPMPEHLRFLECEHGYRAYWPPERVRDYAERERETQILTTLASRLTGDRYKDLVARELNRIARFLEFVQSEKCALYYREAAT